jgi:hypothetical protein
LREIEDAIAEVRLGRRAQAGHRAALRGVLVLGVVHVRRVDQAPARIDRRVIEQPFDRAQAAPLDAVVDFLGLLGDVDVDRCRAVDGFEAGDGVAQPFRRHCAQRMRRHAQPRVLRIAHGLQRFEQAQHRLGRAHEAALALVGRLVAEAAGLVEHRQQREADAGLLRGTQQCEAQRRVVGVGTAVRIVVHVLELADAGVAGFEHLGVEPGRDRFHVLRAEARGKAVHQRAPAPEAVVLLGAVFGEACEGTLEGVRMQVGHAGDHGAGRHLRSGGRLRGGLDLRELADVVPRQQDVLRPPGGKQRIGCEQGARHAAFSTAIRPWRTAVRSGRWPNQ